MYLLRHKLLGVAGSVMFFAAIFGVVLATQQQVAYAAGEQLIVIGGDSNNIQARGGQFSNFNGGNVMTIYRNRNANGAVFQGTYTQTNGTWCTLNGKPASVNITVEVIKGDLYLGNSGTPFITDFRANVDFSCGSGQQSSIPQTRFTDVGFILGTDQVNPGKVDVSGSETYNFAPAPGKATSNGASIKACGGIYNQEGDKCSEFTYVAGKEPASNYNGVPQYVYTGILNSIAGCRAELEIAIPQAEATTASGNLNITQVGGQIYLTKDLQDTNGIGSDCLKPGGDSEIQVKDIPRLGEPEKRKNITIRGQLVDTVLQASATTSKKDTDLKCGGGEFDWAICGVIGLLGSAADKLDSMMTDMLNISPDEIFADTSNPNSAQSGYYAAWNSFRILATALLVIGGLVMVVSQALGFEFLDAYTIRKVLPRLLIAIIGISLSWPLMEFVVRFFNTVGIDVRSLMYAPFKNIGGGIDIGVGIATYIGVIVGGLVLTGLGLLSLLLTAFLSLLVGFVILVIRQLAVLVLIILAPIAIACYILPNTQKVSKLWFDNFLGLMMMFPIISALIAAGHIFAAVSFSDNAPTTGFTQIIGLVAYFIPFFMLPLAARLATGIIGTIAGFVNDKNKGVFDRLKKFRGERAAGSLAGMANGNRFKSENWAANKFNAATRGIAAVPSAGFNPRRMKNNMQAAISRRTMDLAAEYGEKNSRFNVIKGNDDFLIAGIKGKGSDSKVRSELQKMGYSGPVLEQAVAAIRDARRDVSADTFETAATLALPSTGTAFLGGAGEMHEFINDVAGKDRVKASRMLASMRGAATQARRPDLAGGGYGAQLSILEDQYNKRTTSAEASKEIRKQSLEGQSGSYVVSARKEALESFAPVMMEKLAAAGAAGDRETSQELAAIEGRYSAAGNFAPENARILSDKVMSQQIALPTKVRQEDGTITTVSKTMTVREHIEARRSIDPQFQEMSKQFQAASENAEASMRAAEAAAAAGAGGMPQHPGNAMPPGF